MMNVEKQNELIAKMLSDNISEEEKTLLHQWLSESRENAETFEKAKQAWHLTSQQTVFADTDAAWSKLSSSIALEMKPETTKIVPLKCISRIAASLVLIAGIAFLINAYLNQPQLKTIASTNETLKVVLPDNSVAWLNKNSELSFPEKFKGNKREVKLKGEAFFEVVHDDAHAFIITANNTVTEDIGTSFNVRALSAEPNVEVTVATGKVAFTEAGDKSKLYLEPGDKGILNRATHQLSSLRNTDANFLAWKTNRLVFDKNNLREVAATLGKYYNTKFTVNETAATILFTGTFDHTNINDAIKILETSTGIQISKQQNDYILSAK